MTIAILATGDELIHGDTLNTNGRDIAHTLSSEGLSLGLHLSCSDKEAEIIRCLHFLAEKHDIIILIG
ncbi:MAG: molybdopterin-binding protein [Legionella sp.]